MKASTYNIIDIVGVSDESWEDAVRNAIETAGKSLEDLRVGEVTQLDTIVQAGEVIKFRARVKLSFKYLG